MESQTISSSLNITDVEQGIRRWQYLWDTEIKTYGPPLIVFLGTIGNVLSLIVLLQPRMRAKSTFLYLAGVAAADLVFLYVIPLRKWIELVGQSQFMHSYSWACKTVSFVGSVASHYSVWLLVLVTLERFVVIVSPLRGRLLFKRSRALAAMSALLVVIAAINAHMLWTNGIVTLEEQKGTGCAMLPKYAEFSKAWNRADSFIYSILPFIAILTLNCLIILSARGADQMRYRATSSQSNDAKRLTLVLLTVTFTFLLTTVPMSAFMIYTSVIENAGIVLDDKTSRMANVILAGTLCHHIMWINHAINFFLYCFVGKIFRQELCRVMSFYH